MDIKVNHGDVIVLVDDTSGARSPEGGIFEIDYGTVTGSFGKGGRVDFDGTTMKGNSVFGPFTVEIVGHRTSEEWKKYLDERNPNRCHNCNSENQTGKFCSKCGHKMNRE